MQLTRIFSGTQIVSEIPRAGFQRRFGHAHHIVVGHNLLRAVIAHGQDAAALGHEPRCRARQRHQRIGAHVVCDPKRFPAGVDEFTFQRLFRGESHGMQQQMEPAEFPADLIKNPVDFLVLGDIARQQQVSAPKAPASSSTFSFSRSP